jgi:thiamine-monophosphate kinase
MYPNGTSTATVAEVGERAMIERIRARLPGTPPWVSVGIGDDAAVIEPARNRAEVVTTDSLVEGVHFDRRYVPPAAIGHKALAANLSDLAAMGAEPRAAVLSLVLPGDFPVADLDAILDGWLALAARYDVVLIGGNIARSPGPLVIDVTAFGSIKPRRVMRRGGARAGERVYVSGTVGTAYAGFLACRHRASPGGERSVVPNGDLAACEARFLTPEPRVRLGLLLARNRVASSCMDLSDGLADAVHQVAGASGVGMTIDGGPLPIPDAARRWFVEHGSVDPIDAAVSGGEDYELLFTVPPRRRRALAAVMKLAGDVPCTHIGMVTTGRDVLLRRDGGALPLPQGFAHFR